MTKREILWWLEQKKRDTLAEKEAELQKKEDEVKAVELEALGFYKMAEEAEAHLRKAWELWTAWKDAQDPQKVCFSYYTSLDHLMEAVEEDGTFAKHVMHHNMNLCNTALDALKSESKEIRSKIAQAYSSVMDGVQAAANAKAAKMYVERLGFDLSGLGQPDPVVDADYLFLKKTA